MLGAGLILANAIGVLRVVTVDVDAVGCVSLAG